MRIDSMEELEAADADGLLVESLKLEFKEQLPKGTSHNEEIARDLASLAVEGGKLVVGVVDEANRPPTLVPVDLTGLPERVEQIARSRIDPPLFIRPRAIPVDTKSNQGYLVVDVPPSADAPHMVGGKYWARGEKTKRAISDREVADLMARRTHLEDLCEEDLDKYVAGDPVHSEVRELAHLFGVAVPLAAQREALLRRMGDEEPIHVLHGLKVYRRQSVFSPSLASTGSFGSRADGWVFASTPLLASNKQFDPASDKEYSLCEVEFSERGAVRVYNARATALHPTDGAVIMTPIVAGMVASLVHTAAFVGEYMEYEGSWALGVHIDGPIRGVPAKENATVGFGWGSGYSDSEYRELTRAATPEMAERPNDVAFRLIGRFLRAVEVRPDDLVHGPMTMF